MGIGRRSAAIGRGHRPRTTTFTPHTPRLKTSIESFARIDKFKVGRCARAANSSFFGFRVFFAPGPRKGNRFLSLRRAGQFFARTLYSYEKFQALKGSIGSRIEIKTAAPRGGTEQQGLAVGAWMASVVGTRRVP